MRGQSPSDLNAKSPLDKNKGINSESLLITKSLVGKLIPEAEPIITDTRIKGDPVVDNHAFRYVGFGKNRMQNTRRPGSKQLSDAETDGEYNSDVDQDG